jgi:hypothetical protein
MSTFMASPLLKRRLALGACAVTLFIPVLVWLASTGAPQAYLTHRVPPGQTLFVASKLCALLALTLFWLQCMTALARYSPALQGLMRLTRIQHIVLGSTAAGMIAAHVALFMAASAMRTGHAAFNVLIPHFNLGYYSAHLGYGAMALWLLVLAVIAGALRMSGRARWRWPHRAVFMVFVLAMIHGASIGTETRYGLMKYVYAFIALSMAAAVCSWAWAMWARGLRHQPGQRGSPAPASGDT